MVGKLHSKPLNLSVISYLEWLLIRITGRYSVLLPQSQLLEGLKQEDHCSPAQNHPGQHFNTLAQVKENHIKLYITAWSKEILYNCPRLNKMFQGLGVQRSDRARVSKHERPWVQPQLLKGSDTVPTQENSTSASFLYVLIFLKEVHTAIPG